MSINSVKWANGSIILVRSIGSTVTPYWAYGSFYLVHYNITTSNCYILSVNGVSINYIKYINGVSIENIKNINNIAYC